MTKDSKLIFSFVTYQDSHAFIHTYMHAYIHTYIHTLITYSIGQGHCNRKKDSFHGRRYVVKEEYVEKFDYILNNRISTEFEQHYLEGDTETLDKLLFDKILEETHIETSVDTFQKALNTACENTFNKKKKAN